MAPSQIRWRVWGFPNGESLVRLAAVFKDTMLALRANLTRPVRGDERVARLVRLVMLGSRRLAWLLALTTLRVSSCSSRAMCSEGVFARLGARRFVGRTFPTSVDTVCRIGVRKYARPRGITTSRTNMIVV